MNKRLIEYIGEIPQVNYTDVYDFFKGIQDNSPETQVKILKDVLLYIEQQEMFK